MSDPYLGKAYVAASKTPGRTVSWDEWLDLARAWFEKRLQVALCEAAMIRGGVVDPDPYNWKV